MKNYKDRKPDYSWILQIILFVLVIVALIHGGYSYFQIEKYSYIEETIVVDKNEKEVKLFYYKSTKDTISYNKDSDNYKKSYLIGQKLNVKLYKPYPEIYKYSIFLSYLILGIIAISFGFFIT